VAVSVERGPAAAPMERGPAAAPMEREPGAGIFGSGPRAASWEGGSGARVFESVPGCGQGSFENGAGAWSGGERTEPAGDLPPVPVLHPSPRPRRRRAPARPVPPRQSGPGWKVNHGFAKSARSMDASHPVRGRRGRRRPSRRGGTPELSRRWTVRTRAPIGSLPVPASTRRRRTCDGLPSAGRVVPRFINAPHCFRAMWRRRS
jgi:hypothetical protein